MGLSLPFRATGGFRAATDVAAAPQRGANPHLRRRAGQGVDSKNSSYNPFDCSCCHSYRFRYYYRFVLLHPPYWGGNGVGLLVVPDAEAVVLWGIVFLIKVHQFSG